MFKRANKITALLVAAASVMSIVPAMAADSTRLGTKDGTIENAIAFNGKYIYEGYKGDTDKAVYFNDGEKDKELTDYEDYDFTQSGVINTYGEKYILAQDGGDDYLVDLTNGNITEDTETDKLDATSTKLQKGLKKTDKYDLSGLNVALVPGNEITTSASFQEPWYAYTVANTNADTTPNTVNTVNTIFTDAAGKYVDSSVLANVYAYSSEKGKVVKIEKFAKAYTDTKLEANLVGQPTVIAQDKDNIYAVVKVEIVDTSANASNTATKDKYVIDYTTPAAVTVDGTVQPITTLNDIYVKIQDALTNYTVTKSGNVITAVANTAGVVSTPVVTSLTAGVVTRTAGTASGTAAGASKTTDAWYLQKISKTQGDQDDGAYLPKNVTSYQIDNKSLYDNGDVKDAYSWLLNSSATAVDTANIVNVEVKDSSLYVYKLNGSGNVKVNKLDLKQIKENPVDKTVFGTTKLDGYVVKKDGDTDQDFDAYSVDSNGILWVLNDGKIIKFAEKDKTTVYTCDSGLDSLSVYDEKNLIAWNYDDERYTTVTEGTAATQSEAAVVAPAAPVTGWVKNTDGTWSFNDYTGAKVASKWLFLGGSWYYIKADGIMATGWYNDNGTWYYLNGSGAMATGWLQDVDGNWYYLASSGAMLANTTVDGYKLGASGAWIR